MIQSRMMISHDCMTEWSAPVAGTERVVVKTKPGRDAEAEEIYADPLHPPSHGTGLVPFREAP